MFSARSLVVVLLVAGAMAETLVDTYDGPESSGSDSPTHWESSGQEETEFQSTTQQSWPHENEHAEASGEPIAWEASGQESVPLEATETSGQEPLPLEAAESSGSEDYEASGEPTSEFISASGDDTVFVEGERINLFDLAKQNAEVIMFQEAQTIHNNFAGHKATQKEGASDEMKLETTETTVVPEVIVTRARRSTHNLTEESEESTTTKAAPVVPKAAVVKEETAEIDSTKNNTCTAHTTCYSDKECGEKGRCLGIFVGKCNCNACINLLTCEDDGACGGLQGSCNGTTSRCNCIEGYQHNGYPKFIDALRTLCNVKECGRDTDSCHGLPCNSGRCVC